MKSHSYICKYYFIYTILCVEVSAQCVTDTGRSLPLGECGLVGPAQIPCHRQGAVNVRMGTQRHCISVERTERPLAGGVITDAQEVWLLVHDLGAEGLRWHSIDFWGVLVQSGHSTNLGRKSSMSKNMETVNDKQPHFYSLTDSFDKCVLSVCCTASMVLGVVIQE